MFVDFIKAFHSVHSIVNGLLKENVIMTLYKNTKAMVHLLDGDTDFFNIVAVVLQEETLAPYMFLIYLDYRQAIGLMSRVFANGRGDWGSIPGRVIPKTQKMVLDAALLNTVL